MHEVPIVFIFKSSLRHNPIHRSLVILSNMHALTFIYSSSLTLTKVVSLATCRHNASWNLIHAQHLNMEHCHIKSFHHYTSHHLIIMHHHHHVNIMYIITSSYNINTSSFNVITSSYNIIISSYNIKHK